MDERYIEGSDEGLRYILDKSDVSKLLAGEKLSGILKNVTIEMV